MAITLTSVDKTAYGSDGGTPMVISGSFPKDVNLSVYVGSSGTSADRKAHSGLPGNRLLSKDGATLAVYLPMLGPGVYSIFVTDGTSTALLENAVTVVKANYASGIFRLKAVFSPIYAVGPRTLDQVP